MGETHEAIDVAQRINRTGSEKMKAIAKVDGVRPVVEVRTNMDAVVPWQVVEAVADYHRFSLVKTGPTNYEIR